MKAYLFPILLQLIGVAVIITEIFIPSLGLLTAIAVGIFSYSLYIVFTEISSTAGWILAGLDLFLVPALLFMGIKMIGNSRLSLKKQLSQKDGVESQSRELETYLDMKGKSVTDLRPAGMAMIDGLRLDVVTDGEYIDTDTPVVVARVTGNQIIVERDTE